MDRVIRLLAGVAAAGFVAVFTVPASAVPVVTVDGVTFPTGIVPGGNVLESSVTKETGISGPGQQLMGVGEVTAITDGTGLDTAWTTGQNNTELAFEFTGYTSNVVIVPTTAPGSITYTGGTLNYYTLPAGTSISTGTVAGDIAAVESGTLFLSTTAAIEDPAGDTLTETLPASETLGSFADASSFGFLDVTGGAASTYFNSNTFLDAFDTGTGGLADEKFTQDLSTGSTSDGFSVSGSGTLAGNVAAVPEPATAGACALATALLARWPGRRAAGAHR
jgi:hypothetical protein